MKKASQTEIIKFIVVMIVFLAGAITMMIYKIHNPILWIIYVTIWTWAEMKIAKNFHLKWWAWMLIIGGIFLIDFVIISYIN
jgi:hypothetical protein